MTVTGTRPVSALDAALARVGDRWSLLLVATLLDGPMRFNDLRAQLSGIAPNILSDRLRRLESEGILRGEPYSRRPPRFAYALTHEGTDLADALRLLAAWGARGTGAPDAPRHETCGTPLETAWYCPTCSRRVAGPGTADEELRSL